MPRLAGPDDLAGVERITEAAYRPWVAVIGGEPLPMAQDYAALIANGAVWLWEPDGVAAGLIVLEPELDHLYINSVAVDPAFHGRRIGVSLLGFAEDEARRLELCELRLFTHAKMVRNIVLYERFGYRVTGEEPHPVHEDWRVVTMAKTLASAA
jgi:ribosomal protein S18 acetylase RimI-like enzyme